MDLFDVPQYLGDQVRRPWGLGGIGSQAARAEVILATRHVHHHAYGAQDGTLTVAAVAHRGDPLQRTIGPKRQSGTVIIR
jgi:hypothetical protein